MPGMDSQIGSTGLLSFSGCDMTVSAHRVTQTVAVFRDDVNWIKENFHDANFPTMADKIRGMKGLIDQYEGEVVI